MGFSRSDRNLPVGGDILPPSSLESLFLLSGGAAVSLPTGRLHVTTRVRLSCRVWHFCRSLIYFLFSYLPLAPPPRVTFLSGGSRNTWRKWLSWAEKLRWCFEHIDTSCSKELRVQGASVRRRGTLPNTFTQVQKYKYAILRYFTLLFQCISDRCCSENY